MADSRQPSYFDLTSQQSRLGDLLVLVDVRQFGKLNFSDFRQILFALEPQMIIA